MNTLISSRKSWVIAGPLPTIPVIAVAASIVIVAVWNPTTKDTAGVNAIMAVGVGPIWVAEDPRTLCYIVLSLVPKAAPIGV